MTSSAEETRRLNENAVELSSDWLDRLRAVQAAVSGQRARSMPELVVTSVPHVPSRTPHQAAEEQPAVERTALNMAATKPSTTIATEPSTGDGRGPAGSLESMTAPSLSGVEDRVQADSGQAGPSQPTATPTRGLDPQVQSEMASFLSSYLQPEADSTTQQECGAVANETGSGTVEQDRTALPFSMPPVLAESVDAEAAHARTATPLKKFGSSHNFESEYSGQVSELSRVHEAELPDSRGPSEGGSGTVPSRSGNPTHAIPLPVANAELAGEALIAGLINIDEERFRLNDRSIGLQINRLVDRMLEKLPPVSPAAVVIGECEPQDDAAPLCLQLAVGMAKRDLAPVLVIDASIGGTLTEELRLVGKPGLLQCIDDSKLVGTCVFQTQYGEVNVLPLGVSSAAAKMTSSHVHRLLRDCCQRYKYVLVMVGDVNGETGQLMAGAADATYLAVDLATNDQTAIEQTIATLNRAGARTLGCVSLEAA